MCTHSSPDEVSMPGTVVQTCLPTCRPFAGVGTIFTVQCPTQESIAKGNALGTKATCPVGAFGPIWAQLK